MYTAIKSVLVALIIMSFSLSCNEHKRDFSEHPRLKVSLEERPVSIFDLFKRIEIIPLTSSEESLFAYTEKVEVFNDTIFIFDRTLYALYIFGPNGRYINKIRKVGRGPGEYPMASDFVINPRNRSVCILNPMGIINEYDFNGTFIHDVHLPQPPKNYRFFELLDSDTYVTWSSVYEKNRDAVTVLDKMQKKVRHSHFPYSSLWGSLRYGSVFNSYKDTTYYHETLTNRVYSITANSCRIAYEWDINVELIDPEKLVVSEKELVAAQHELFTDFKDGTIPFFFGPQFQSEKYYYTLLTFSQPAPVRKSLFYDRYTGENWLFAKTKEGLSLDIKYMTDDYALGFINYEDKDILKNMVSEKEALLLERMKEDDNSWIVKFIMR